MNSAISCLGNVIWFLCGGIVMGLVWWLYGLLCFISIVGIPWGRACFVMGSFAFFPLVLPGFPWVTPVRNWPGRGLDRHRRSRWLS